MEPVSVSENDSSGVPGLSSSLVKDAAEGGLPGEECAVSDDLAGNFQARRLRDDDGDRLGNIRYPGAYALPRLNKIVGRGMFSR